MKNRIVLLIFMVAFLYSCAAPSSRQESISQIPQQPKISLKVVKQDKNQQEIEIRKGEVLSRSDKYAAWVSTQTDVYIYVFQVDAKENKIQLFPNPKYSNRDNLLKSNETIRVPDSGRWFESDKTTGIKEIFVLSPKEPLADPDKVCKQILEDSRKPAGVDEPKTPDSRVELPVTLKFHFIQR